MVNQLVKLSVTGLAIDNVFSISVTPAVASTIERQQINVVVIYGSGNSIYIKGRSNAAEPKKLSLMFESTDLENGTQSRMGPLEAGVRPGSDFDIQADAVLPDVLALGARQVNVLSSDPSVFVEPTPRILVLRRDEVH
jgi:hypothetical protein